MYFNPLGLGAVWFGQGFGPGSQDVQHRLNPKPDLLQNTKKFPNWTRTRPDLRCSSVWFRSEPQSRPDHGIPRPKDTEKTQKPQEKPGPYAQKSKVTLEHTSKDALKTSAKPTVSKSHQNLTLADRPTVLKSVVFCIRRNCQMQNRPLLKSIFQ
jgi:hypothetical protein